MTYCCFENGAKFKHLVSFIRLSSSVPFLKKYFYKVSLVVSFIFSVEYFLWCVSGADGFSTTVVYDAIELVVVYACKCNSTNSDWLFFN